MSINELATKAKEYHEIQAMIRGLEGEAEAIKTAIVAEMEAKEINSLRANGLTIRNTVYRNSRIDAEALKKDLPEVANRYTKVTEARCFQVL